MKNKQVKQMICDCHNFKYREIGLTITYWKGGQLQQCGDIFGSGFCRVPVMYYRAISLTANQLKGK